MDIPTEHYVDNDSSYTRLHVIVSVSHLSEIISFLIRLYQSSYFIPLSSHESVILSSIFHYHYHDQQKQPVILSLIQSIDMTMEYS